MATQINNNESTKHLKRGGGRVHVVSTNLVRSIFCQSVLLSFYKMTLNAKIQRNRNIALMRTKNRRNCFMKVWVAENFWSPDIWPDHIVNCLMKFQYTDRICICNFLFGNGLQLNNAFDLIAFYHEWNLAERNHYEYVFSKLWWRLQEAVRKQHPDWHHITSSYYFYSMVNRTVMFFDGTIRKNGNKINLVHNENIHNAVRLPHTTLEIQNSLQSQNDETRPVELSYRVQREQQDRLNRRWSFLASLDGNPLIIDGVRFKFDWSLYTNTI